MMKNEKFWQEGMDGKRFALCSFRRLWLLAVFGLLGAAVSAGLYLLVTVVLAGPVEYQVFSQYRIYFDSEKYGEIQDYYNAYTWGEIMKTDEVLDFVMEALPEGITKEQVKESVSVGAMNDVKIMPLYITTHDKELSETIARAYVYGLDRFGHSIEGLDGMDCWLLEEAKEVPRGTKAGNAALLGFVLGAAAAFFAWLFFYCLDDSIYLEADFENRYGCPVLGLLTLKKDPEYRKELETALAFRLNGKRSVCVTDAAKAAVKAAGNAAANAEENAAAKAASPAGIFPKTGLDRLEDALAEGKEETAFEECIWPFDGKTAEKMRQEGVLLLLPWGRGSGRMAGRLMDQMAKVDIPVLGAVIYGAGDGFLRAYYGRKGEGT